METARVLGLARGPDHGFLAHLPVLADSLRCRMLLLLERHELTVGELCAVMQLPQSTVSRHLKTLADAQWVTSRREGTSRYYGSNLPALDTGAQRLWPLVREQVGVPGAVAEDERRVQRVLAARRSKSAEFFSSVSGQWDHVREELFGATFHLHALLALLDREAVVGDLGCGTGQLSELVAPHVRRVIAVDGSPEMLSAARERLREHPQVDLRTGTVEALPIDTGQLDIAVLALVLHHVPDPALALAECARVLTPGGRVLVIDMLPHDREEYQRQMGHVWLGFSAAQAKKLLRAAGFEDARVLPLPISPDAKGPALFAATARKRTKNEERRTKNGT